MADEAELRILHTFVVQLGAAMNAIGEPVQEVQRRLQRAAAAYGAADARISAYPTSLLVTLGTGTSATLELTTPLASMPRLDQVAAVDRLVTRAEHGEVLPADGLRELGDIRTMPSPFGPLVQLVGYSVLTVGICLILDPSARDVAVAAVLGLLVGGLRLVTRKQPTLQILMPVLAAFCVSACSALAVQQELASPGLRAMIAALVVFLPGAALTTAVWELAEGEMIAGSSRLVWAAVQLALLSFGILAGVGVVGISFDEAFVGSPQLLGAWAPWLGVLLFAIGVAVAHSTPRSAFPALLVVLYAAWVGQYLGGLLFGGLTSSFIGALVMTPVAFLLAQTRFGMPAFAMFLPGFWLLVPGAMSLIGLTERATTAGPASGTIGVVTGSILGVVLGVLCGSLAHAWLTQGARRVTGLWPS